MLDLFAEFKMLVSEIKAAWNEGNFRAKLRVRAGLLAGEICARPTFTLLRCHGERRIAACQTTQVKDLTRAQLAHRSV